MVARTSAQDSVVILTSGGLTMNLLTNTRNGALSACLAFAGLSGIAPTSIITQVAAQEGALEEIIVTATRRTTNIQDTPLSISAVSGTRLRDAGINHPRDLSGMAPNLHVDQGLAVSQTHVSIRGIASTDFMLGASSPVAVYIDDVYQPVTFGVATNMYDMNRIEVLRGPQGTLFGKNTTSGALNLYSQAPTSELEGYVQFDGGGGEFGHYSVEGAFNTPVSDQVSIRLSGRYDRRDDYVNNLLDGTEEGSYDSFNGRAQILWQPSDDTSVHLKLYGVDYEGDGPVYSAQYLHDNCAAVNAGVAGFVAAYACPDGINLLPDSPDQHNVNSEYLGTEAFSQIGLVAKIEHEFSDYVLTSVTGWQDGDFHLSQNDDGVATDLFHSTQISDTNQISQELRLATPEERRFRAVLGLFYQYEDYDASNIAVSTELDTGTTPFVDNFGLDFLAGSRTSQETESYAVFGSFTYDVADNFSLTAGVRYSDEERDISDIFIGLNGFNYVTFGLHNPVLDLTQRVSREDADAIPFDPLADVLEVNEFERSWDDVTWDVTANWTPNDDLLFYARFANGFRSGGFSTGIVAAGTFAIIDPEDIMSYELGFKSEWQNGSLRLNGAVYHNEYEDMQVQQVALAGFGLTLVNAASSEITGVELELEYAPTEALYLMGSLGYNDATFKDYPITDPRAPTGNNSGNPLPYAPEWTTNLIADYTVALDNFDLVFSTKWTYKDDYYFDAFMDPLVHEDSALVGDLQLAVLPDGHNWRVTAYVQNVTDNTRRAFQYQLENTLAPAVHMPERLWGFRVAYHF